MSSPAHRSVVVPRTPMSYPSEETCPGKILLIDPDSHGLVVLSSVLAAKGYAVCTTGTAQDAWSLIQQMRPDLILLEIDLADQSGFELCRQLKQSLQTRRIPVMFLGTGNDPTDRRQAFRVGGVDFIPKPYWDEEVLARVQTHLALGQAQQRLQHFARRSLAGRENFPLLASLQRTLHQQAVKLREQNAQLQREVRERQQVEIALRQEQQKSEQLLLNILPEAVVTRLKQFQGSLAERFDEATVLFADIANFTPLAAQMSPLELVNLLNLIFSAFDRLAEKYQLEKIKTIGDAYMVVGGVPVPQENHAVAVADMAMAMQAVIQQFTRGENDPLQIRIGINTGTVVAGVIGIKKFTYDLWGDTVNVASRMEAQGMPGKIQVTEATYQRLQEQFVFAPAQEVFVKGKGLMATYYLLGRR